jgi:EAL and modified HD-GYP domain-containing signal transduction protein
MRLLTALGQAEIDFSDVESIIKSDAVLASSLLKYLNSAALGMRQSITSIRHALTLLGERPLRKWGTLVAFAGMCDGKPHELLVASLVRAHFCEGVASAIGQEVQAIDYFLVGLLSTIDAVTDRPMPDALASVSVSEAVRRTLLDDGESSLGCTLALVRACEIGAWASVIRLGSELGLTHRDVAARYYETLKATHAFFE